MKKLCAAVLCSFLLGAGAPLVARAAALPSLERTLRDLSRQTSARTAIAIEDLASRRVVGVNLDAGMPAASVIKIPVMVEVFRQMEAGRFGLRDRATLLARDRDWGWGDLADAALGGTYTIDRLLRLMIAQSDNTATNMLIRRVGRENINATMRRLHLARTILGEDIRSEGRIRSLRTSPRDMIALLDAMARDALIDPWSSRAMLAILLGQEHNGLLPRPLPPGLPIAHKTGTLFDTLNDVGIVYAGAGPYAIAVMTTRLPDLDVGRSFIRRVSRAAYDAMAAPAALPPVARAAPSPSSAAPETNPEDTLAGLAATPLAPLLFPSTAKL